MDMEMEMEMGMFARDKSKSSTVDGGDAGGAADQPVLRLAQEALVGCNGKADCTRVR